MIESSSDVDFYKESSRKIFDWLPEDQKFKVFLELLTKGFNSLDELSPKERFFFMLNFIDNNFIRQYSWAKKIDSLIDSLSKKSYELPIKLEFSDFPLTEKVKAIFLERNLEQDFYSMLKETGLSEEYFEFTKRRLMDKNEPK